MNVCAHLQKSIREQPQCSASVKKSVCIVRQLEVYYNIPITRVVLFF